MIFGRQVGVFKELIELVLNGRFGSLAVIQDSIIRTAAFGRKADVPLRSLRADDSGNSARSSYCLDPFRVATNAQVTDRIAPRGFRLLGQTTG